MRLRTVGGCVVAMALCAQAPVASAAKPHLWLKDEATGERVAPGTAVSSFIEIEENCAFHQEATLVTNGKARDKVTVQPAIAHVEGCTSDKMGGAVSSWTLRPSGSEAMTMTVKSSIHIFVEPWCVYALPKKLTLTPASPVTFDRASVSIPLDKSASFAACPSNRAVTVGAGIPDSSGNDPLVGEITG